MKNSNYTVVPHTPHPTRHTPPQQQTAPPEVQPNQQSLSRRDKGQQECSNKGGKSALTGRWASSCPVRFAHKNDRIYFKNRDELKPALLELALTYKVNKVLYEMEKSQAANSNNQTGITSESESSDSGSEDEVVSFEGEADDFTSRARTYQP